MERQMLSKFRDFIFGIFGIAALTPILVAACYEIGLIEAYSLLIPWLQHPKFATPPMSITISGLFLFILWLYLALSIIVIFISPLLFQISKSIGDFYKNKKSTIIPGEGK